MPLRSVSMMSTRWPKEREDTLRALHVQGLTSNQMSAVLEITRNSVVGKCKRLGLPLTRRPRKRPQKPLPEEPPQEPQEVLPGVSVLEARMEHCRWPISLDGAPYRFCGEPRVFPFSWCLEHGKLAYRVPPAQFTTQAVADKSTIWTERLPSFTSHPKLENEGGPSAPPSVP